MSAYEQAKKTIQQAADDILKVAKGKAAAALRTPEDVLGEATARAKKENWNQTPGPRQ